MELKGVFVLGKQHTYTILKHTDALLIAIKEVLDVNTEKSRYTLMSCEQNAQQNNINAANKSSENLVKFKHWGMMQMIIACMKNLRAEYIRKCLCHLIQNLMSASML
jgi:hypothetical protein